MTSSKTNPVTNVIPLPPRRPILTEYDVIEPEMSPMDIVGKYNLDKPIYCLVQSDYSGPIIEKPVKKGHVLFVCCSATQRRLVGTAILDGKEMYHYTFHPDTGVPKVQVLQNGRYKSDKRNTRLSDIMKNHPLPLTMRFSATLEGAPEPPSLRITHFIDETNLLCNIIERDKFDEDVLYIPGYLSDIVLKEVVGIVNKDADDWKRYKKRMDHESTCVEYDMQYSTTDIICYGELAKSQLPLTKNTHAQYIVKWEKFFEEFNALNYKHVTPILPSIKTTLDKVLGQEKAKVESDEASGFKFDDSTDLYDAIDNDTYYEIPFDAEEGNSKKDESVVSPISGQGRNPNNVVHGEAVGIGNKNDKQRKPSAKEPRKQLATPTNLPSKYNNIIPRGEAFGIVRQQDVKPENCAVMTTASPPIHDVKSVDDVSKLTIHDVCAYLQRLGLEQYVPFFKENMVDGAILSVLEKEMLIKDFGLKPIEAVKLEMFAKKGHIPK